jgi:hypothetical protein
MEDGINGRNTGTASTAVRSSTLAAIESAALLVCTHSGVEVKV